MIGVVNAVADGQEARLRSVNMSQNGTCVEKLYLLEGSGELGDDPADGKAHASEQQHFPGLRQHEE